MTPCDDPRAILLDDYNDTLRRERRRLVRVTEPQAWRGEGARLIPWEGIRVTVVYVPTILRSMEEIKKAFGVGEKQVRTWVEQGAPIAVEGRDRNTRYSAELIRLQLLREEQTPRQPDDVSGDD